MPNPIVQFKYCCNEMKEAIEGPLNVVHISELREEKEISSLYMMVETQSGTTLPCFLKFCPECGTEISKHRWTSAPSPKSKDYK